MPNEMNSADRLTIAAMEKLGRFVGFVYGVKISIDWEDREQSARDIRKVLGLFAIPWGLGRNIERPAVW